jgi:hypothetical protein
VRVRRGLIFLLPLLVLALLASACGSRTALEGDVLASAAAKTEEAGSSRVAFQIDGDVLGRDVALRGTGAFDYESSRGRLQLDASGLLRGATVEVRAVDSVLYLRLPVDLSLWIPSVKPWVAVRSERALESFGLGELQQRPGQLLELLRASSTQVSETGTAVVRGVETTQYTAQLELTRALDANAGELGLSERERAELRRAVEELRRQSRQQTLPVVVFVDGEGLVRRLTVTRDGERISVDFWDFGVDVDVQAPPAADVHELSG